MIGPKVDGSHDHGASRHPDRMVRRGHESELKWQTHLVSLSLTRCAAATLGVPSVTCGNDEQVVFMTSAEQLTECCMGACHHRSTTSRARDHRACDWGMQGETQ